MAAFPSGLRIYIDADVLRSGITTENSTAASAVLLTLSEATVIELITSDVPLDECERNLASLTDGPALRELSEDFRAIVQRSVTVVDPPGTGALREMQAQADPKDLPHLVAAVQHGCPLLVTRNVTDYQPGHSDVDVVTPGELVRRIREQLYALESGDS